jgi:hypothetical protein
MTFMVTFVFQNQALADIYTPVATKLDHKEFSSVLNRYYKEGFKLNGELSEVPKVKGLTAEFSKITYNAHVNPDFEISRQGLIDINAEIPFAYFEMRDLKLQHKMIRRVGSAIVNINTKVECKYLKISLSEKVNLKTNGQILNGKPRISKVNLPENLDFKIEGENCTGPKDFENFLPEIALEWLLSEEGNIEILKFLNEEIIKNFWKDLKKGLEIEFFGRKIYMALLKLTNIEEEFSADIMLRWPAKDKFYLNLQEPISDNTLAIKSQDLNYVLKNWVTNGCFDFTFLRSEISGVETLFGNRLYQFFIWPDLRNFNKEASFNLKVKVCFDSFRINKISVQDVEFLHASQVFIQMNFIGPENKELPYIFLWSKAAGLIKAKTSRDGLSFNLSKSNFDFKFMYHPQMMKWRRSKPSGGPALKTILSFILPELEKLNTPILENFKELFQSQKIIYDQNKNLEFKD